MSVNHYSTDHHHHNTLLWRQQHHHTTDTYPPETTTTTSTWLNDDQKESLFEKTLTPSDVGKLNRLVIPKQHAEKYFPLNNVTDTSSSSSSSSEKGMLLSFEDESGKCWRFRYSYWNSSQSYVLTKGWSRFVKDKQLDPGDVVFFQRQRSHSSRFFIGCRRRGQISSSSSSTAAVNTSSYSTSMPPPYLQLQASTNYSNPPSHLEYSHYGAAVTTAAETHSIPSSSAVTGSSRTVRLFGVNLECQMDEDGDATATATAVDCPDGYYGQNMYYYYSPHPHNMNIAFTGDTMKKLGDRRG